MATGIAKGRRAVRAWRENQSPKVTQEALGRDIGVSGSAIRHFENGKKNFDLSLSVKVKLSRRTRIRLDWLLSSSERHIFMEARELLGGEAA